MLSLETSIRYIGKGRQERYQGYLCPWVTTQGNLHTVHMPGIIWEHTSVVLGTTGTWDRLFSLSQSWLLRAMGKHGLCLQIPWGRPGLHGIWNSRQTWPPHRDTSPPSRLGLPNVWMLGGLATALMVPTRRSGLLCIWRDSHVAPHLQHALGQPAHPTFGALLECTNSFPAAISRELVQIFPKCHGFSSTLYLRFAFWAQLWGLALCQYQCDGGDLIWRKEGQWTPTLQWVHLTIKSLKFIVYNIVKRRFTVC